MAEDKGLTRAEREERVLQFWKDNNIFEKTLEKDAPKGDFVFYEGPPGANGRPGLHHMESRFFKDAIPRYKTMQGFRVPRQAGWDTHGLPVELEVEKQLGFKNKKEIEEYGVERFNALCREVVWKYVDEWERLSERIGFWLDFAHAYATYRNSYIEGVWQVMQHIADRDLLYKDYKVVPWCPRCGTALSSHELAQGYQDVKDLSLYVKFKIPNPKSQNKYFLAWTTTPWTLPGNVALAVGPDITYVEAKVAEEVYVLAKDRLAVLTEPYEIVAEHKGSEMVGMGYEPLYPFIADNGKAFKVYAADFVTAADGTGIVHTAVMYGQDDFDLGSKVGLPKVHLVTPEGMFMRGAGWLEGRSVVDAELAVDILKDLQQKDAFFAKENHLHSYPFCWRCKTRLIYYARDSWYVRMSDVRAELVKENEQIHWEPDYIRDGRFGDWLREVKDWAISRERYWGTPLPVWENGDKTKRLVVDSIETIKRHTKRSGNRYFVMRHGEGTHNTSGIVASRAEDPIHLTDHGREQVELTAQSLKEIDIIYASPFVRTRETVELIKRVTGYSGEVVFDPRIGEIDAGEHEGQSFSFIDFFQGLQSFDQRLEGGESPADVRRRLGDFIYDVDSKHHGQNVLIVTHGVFFEVFPSVLEGYEDTQALAHLKSLLARVATGEMQEYIFVPLPHDRDYRLDLHKPFIDSVVLEQDGEEYRRASEVMDVWFDSGAMPFAAFDSARAKPSYPADFICEGLDQTRGWFYTLHAIGILMERGKAFNNVICLGLILDKDGKKMSKSLGNAVDPWAVIETYGVDVLRLWMYSVNQPGENKNFDERSVEEVQKRVFNLLDNVFSFYELYRDRSLESDEHCRSGNVLDQWILYRLNELVAEMTERLDEYKLLEPVRGLRDFVDDLSTWWLRRSRERLKAGEAEAAQTIYYVLKTLSKLLAPFAPFAAEELYQKLRLEGDPLSVHLAEWPKAGEVDHGLIEPMKRVRELASVALMERSKANIKIRQPLPELVIDTPISSELSEILKDEVNVKKITIDRSLVNHVRLDTTITPKLEEEGRMRELVRSIQDLRKERGLKPGETMEYDIKPAERPLFDAFGDEICRITSIRPRG